MNFATPFHSFSTPSSLWLRVLQFHLSKPFLGDHNSSNNNIKIHFFWVFLLHLSFTSSHTQILHPLHLHIYFCNQCTSSHTLSISNKVSKRTIKRVACNVVEVLVTELFPASGGDGRKNWEPMVPLVALLRGEHRVIIQYGEDIPLLWYKDQVFTIENRSPAKGDYFQGLINAKQNQV